MEGAALHSEQKQIDAVAIDASAPKHEQLRNSLVDQIKSGHLRPGDMLPSEQDIGEMLGMARSTVRQALASLDRDGLLRRVRGKGTFVQEDARQKLRRGADLFALVVPELHAGYYPSLQSGFEAAAGEVSNQIIVANTHNNVDQQAHILLQLLDKNISGAAIVPTTAPPTPAYQIRVLHKQRIPIVFCHRRVEGISAPLLTFDGVGVGRLAAESMIAHGHRHVAFIAGSRSNLGTAYETGFRETLSAAGVALPADRVCFGEPCEPGAEHAQNVERVLKRMFDQSNPPTAIFSTFDSEAELIYLTLARMGVRVPDDVSLIGFGGTVRDRPFIRQLTSVVVDEVALGRTAARVLNEIRLGERELENNETITLPVAMSDGQTLAPMPCCSTVT